MTKIVTTNYLFLENIKRFVPWHLFIGAPKFPEYPLFKPDTGYGKTIKVDLSYDSDGYLDQIKGENRFTDKISIDFSYNDITKKAKGEFKKDSKVELTVTEWVANNELYLDIEYPADSDLDIQMKCKLDTGKNYDMEIDVNGKTLKGTFTLGSGTIPQIAYDLVDVLDNIRSTATVAALDEVLSYSLASEYYRRGFGIVGGTDDFTTFNEIVVGVVDIINPLLSIPIGIICYILIHHT